MLQQRLIGAVAMAAMLAVVGFSCGGSDDSTANPSTQDSDAQDSGAQDPSTQDPSTQDPSIAGTWKGTVDGQSTTLKLTQNGNSVSGSMTGWPADETCDGTHTVTGSFNGNTASLHVVCPGGGDVNDWTVTVDNNTMTGGIKATRSG